MPNENGTWIMHGVSKDDPTCIHTVDKATAYINAVGFLPLFKNEIPGVSLEEVTVPEDWWSGDPEHDPWEWREIIARRGEIAYGKFFDRKAGFVSKKWLPYFVNFRRDGYDFDALWEDGKAPLKHKKIMDLYAEDLQDSEYYSYDIKKKAGFGKDSEKGFEGAITSLQMEMYLCVHDFQRRKNKKGEEYGWRVASYCTPEHLFGYDYVRSAYSEDPKESAKRIASRMIDIRNEATNQQIARVIGVKAGERKEPEKKAKKVAYPANILKDLGLDLVSFNNDQMLGLEYVLGMLKPEYHEMLILRYEYGKSYKDVGMTIGRSGSSVSHQCKINLQKIKDPKRLVWITEGFNKYLNRFDEQIKELSKRFIREGKYEQAYHMLDTPDSLVGISKNHAECFFKQGYKDIGSLCILMEDSLWYEQIPGIGRETSKKIVTAMCHAGYIDKP